MNLLFTHTICLLNVASPVKHSLEMSRAISELGILIVIAGVMITMFVLTFIFVFKTINRTNEKMLETQELLKEQNKQIIAQNNTIQELLGKIADAEADAAKKEQTRYNAESIIKMSLSDNLITLLRGVEEIILKNHIEDKVTTEKKINSLVTSAHQERVKLLNSSTYDGSKLGDLSNNDTWIERKKDLIRDFIYSKDQNYMNLLRELNLANSEFNYELSL